MAKAAAGEIYKLCWMHPPRGGSNFASLSSMCVQREGCVLHGTRSLAQHPYFIAAINAVYSLNNINFGVAPCSHIMCFESLSSAAGVIYLMTM